MIVYASLYDKTILHFIGQWHLLSEEARLRAEFASFRRIQAEEEEPGNIAPHAPRPSQFHIIKDYIPGVEHHPVLWHPRGWGNLDPPDRTGAQAGFEAQAFEGQRVHPLAAHPHFHHSQPGPGLIDAPGQVIFVSNQAIWLEDNDILNLGDGPTPVLDPSILDRLHELAAQASAGNPFLMLQMPHDAADIGAAVSLAHQVITDLPEQYSGGLVAAGSTLAGHWVNGAEVSEAPNLDDLLPVALQPDEPASVTVSDHAWHAIEGQAPAGGLHLEAGANLLVNSAILQNLGLLGKILAVNGDVYRLDTICQANVVSDVDSAGALPGAAAANSILNYANFTQQHAGGAPASVISAEGPQNWVINVVQGDLIFTQWLKQTNFINDNDIHVLTETGASSNLVTGANYAHNIVDFNQLGQVYDLILVGGNLYDANIITQLNVLLDNDWIAAGLGNQATSGNNLLFNGATIANAGAQNWLAGLPDHYLKALEQLGNGRLDMPDGFSSDDLLAGIATLKVLVVTGNIYDLHYISQTNILGDSDLVAAAQQAAFARAGSDAQLWEISTGQNALLNIAAIADTDALGDTAFYGGNLYSDAVLIQSEILSGPDQAGFGVQPLASEAIAFITADDGYDTYCPDQGITPTSGDGHSMDAMGSVLA